MQDRKDRDPDAVEYDVALISGPWQLISFAAAYTPSKGRGGTKLLLVYNGSLSDIQLAMVTKAFAETLFPEAVFLLPPPEVHKSFDALRQWDAFRRLADRFAAVWASFPQSLVCIGALSRMRTPHVELFDDGLHSYVPNASIPLHPLRVYRCVYASFFATWRLNSSRLHKLAISLLGRHASIGGFHSLFPELLTEGSRNLCRIHQVPMQRFREAINEVAKTHGSPEASVLRGATVILGDNLLFWNPGGYDDIVSATRSCIEIALKRGERVVYKPHLRAPASIADDFALRYRDSAFSVWRSEAKVPLEVLACENLPGRVCAIFSAALLTFPRLFEVPAFVIGGVSMSRYPQDVQRMAGLCSSVTPEFVESDTGASK